MGIATTIKILPEHLQNRIAAGEVVERPASVVKELLENALDAGARTIRIDLEGAGKRLIRVTDDGCGLEPRAARLAVQRYATSKIASARDLDAIASFGFRGEALAAIAAVCRFRLTSSPPGRPTGHCIELTGGTLEAETPAPPVGGTDIVVRDLFFNTPARLKFLKSDATELWHVADCVHQAAVSDRAIGYTLTHNGRTLLEAPAAASLEDRLFDLFGRGFVTDGVAVAAAADDVAVTGWIPLATHHGVRRQQYLFVNGRPVRHAGLARMVYDATDRLRPARRHPAFVLMIELPLGAVDVNVHPTKREIRFTALDTVRRVLYHALAPVRDRPPGRSISSRALAEGAAGLNAAPSAQPDIPPANPATRLREPSVADDPPVRRDAIAPPLFSPGLPERFYLRFSGTFVAYADGDGMTVVDQHAAHERVLFERFMKRVALAERLLIPRQVELSAADVTLLLEHRDALAEFGLALEAFGERALVVREVPPELKGRSLEPVLRDLAASLAVEGRADAEALRRTTAARLACHDALRAGDHPTDAELTHLLVQLEACDEPGACPHGRPTRVHLGSSELRRRFRRE